MTVFFLFIFGLYFLLMLFLLYGWEKAMVNKLPEVRERITGRITVVIPFRNEEANIENSITDLVNQSYSSAFYEVVFVDDHSTDRSNSRVALKITSLPNFRLISLPAENEGKKKAITLGIEKSIGDIIVTTDADCRLSTNWLASINDQFQGDGIKMTFGGVKIAEKDSFFSKLQAMEFSSLIGSGAATLNLGYPSMCNGANLAFLKTAFIEVNGYEGNFNISSGDDEFLMRKIITKFPGSICFLHNPESVVSTLAQKSLKDFLYQRLRWAGKWKYNSSVSTKLLALYIFLSQLSFICVVGLTLMNKLDLKTAFFLIGGKIVFEFIFLSKICAFLGVKWRTLYFLLLQFIYPIYVVSIALASNFISPLWKERKI
jgi:poly-beta-1,6-N-acetyl-D-glucosamine synthase